MDRHTPLFGGSEPHPEQQPPMRQQGDRWPDELESATGGERTDEARPSDLDGV